MSLEQRRLNGNSTIYQIQQTRQRFARTDYPISPMRAATKIPPIFLQNNAMLQEMINKKLSGLAKVTTMIPDENCIKVELKWVGNANIEALKRQIEVLYQINVIKNSENGPTVLHIAYSEEALKSINAQANWNFKFLPSDAPAVRGG